MNSFTTTFDGDSVDASLLLLAELGVVEWTDPMYVGTVERIGKTLRRGAFLARYAEPDDFGMPEVAFSVCTFWYINALWSIGHKAEARELFERDAASAQRRRPDVRGSGARQRRDVGQLSADLQHGRHHQLRDAAVALVGRSAVARAAPGIHARRRSSASDRCTRRRSAAASSSGRCSRSVR
jgi:hypothetical protein